MEPWKLAVIAALVASFVGYGVFANSGFNSNPIPSAITPLPSASATPPKYVGKTLPAWPSIKQWVNTPAPVKLSALKGKPVLLEVFRIECSHCQEAAPFLVQLHARYAPRGLQFVGIQSPGDLTDPQNPESNWTTVQAWIKAKGYTWPVGFDSKSAWFQGNFSKGVYYPSLFLLDKTGKVVFFQSGHDDAKALNLGVELERIAPGPGDVKTRANDLSRFMLPTLNLSGDTTAQKSLADDINGRLGGATTTTPKAAASMMSPAFLLLSLPVGAGAWLWQRRKRTI